MLRYKDYYHAITFLIKHFRIGLAVITRLKTQAECQ